MYSTAARSAVVSDHNADSTPRIDASATPSINVAGSHPYDALDGHVAGPLQTQRRLVVVFHVEVGVIARRQDQPGALIDGAPCELCGLLLTDPPVLHDAARWQCCLRRFVPHHGRAPALDNQSGSVGDELHEVVVRGADRLVATDVDEPPRLGGQSVEHVAEKGRRSNRRTRTA